ncbi:hypothetical protein OE88DRAFT_1735156 [Heliocybe sulcata]|uniref:Uncharacterized protein n=1 Tax=Heliocybe sulcata TaxID=5364 RepID=A0A5C3N501_9AGAM|nr:hypothetical protein OE88DRAFT_1735156 [Heliocybe sulcata]
MFFSKTFLAASVSAALVATTSAAPVDVPSAQYASARRQSLPDIDTTPSPGQPISPLPLQNREGFFFQPYRNARKAAASAANSRPRSNSVPMRLRREAALDALN